MKNYNVIHQTRNGHKGGGLCILHESLCYNIRKDLCTNNYDIEILAIKIESKSSKNIILNVIYRQLNGDLRVSENYFNDFFSKNEKNFKKIILVRESILKERRIFELNIFSQYDPTITNPTRVTRNTATAIDCFITNTVVDTQFKTGSLQTDLSDHFHIISALKTNDNMVEKHNEHFVYKRCYDEKSTNLFKQKLHETT